MKKPSNLEMKRWVCGNTIVGLRVWYYQVGVDTADTDWELVASGGGKKRVKRHLVENLVDVKPDYVRVLRVKKEVVDEVAEWDKYAEKEKSDLAEYERLKKKFEGSRS